MKTQFAKAIIPYMKFKKMYKVYTKEGELKGKNGKHWWFSKFNTSFFVKNMILSWTLDLSGSTFMQQSLTKSPRTEQPSLWTCCQLLEAPWDSSLGSPSSVEWRLPTLQSRSSSKYSKTVLTKNKWSLLLRISKAAFM